MKKGVVLLHGIFRTARSMERLARHLRQNGYAVLNVDYPSTRLPLESIIEVIHPTIENFIREVDGPVSFVGYSMGGLVIRAYLAKYRPPQLARVVMLGTPNGGSEIADRFKNLRLYQRFYGPAGQQLITVQEAFLHLFGQTDYDVGVIAGNWSIDPISSWIIGQSNDGKVSVNSTRLLGMKDHIIVPVPHTLFPVMKIVHRQTLAFLETGMFAAKR